MGDISKHCPMCGATPGEPCTYVSTLTPDHEMVREGHDVAHVSGDVRPDVHFYRANDRPITVLIPDEPPYADS
jgi:hypothetical protein